MKLLAVIDYQVDFVSGSLGFPGAEEMDRPIARRIREVLEEGDQVLVTYDTHGADYLNTREGRALPVPHCIQGTEGWELYGEVRKTVEEHQKKGMPITVFRKGTFGASPESYAAFSRDRSFEEIEVVGLVTNICVVSNICCLQAAFPEAQIKVDASLVKTFDPQLQTATLEVLKGLQVAVL